MARPCWTSTSFPGLPRVSTLERSSRLRQSPAPGRARRARRYAPVVRYDLELFKQLQDEYRDRPIVPKPQGLDGGSMLDTARRRVTTLDARVGLRGKRVLEVGCGRSHTLQVLADEWGCDVVGVDVLRRPEWAGRPDLQLHEHDIATGKNEFLGTFDRIISFAVWEHIRSPFHALQAAKDLLRPDGQMYINANLYRGPKASHRYREVYFPWPHLLFPDEVIADYYAWLVETGQRRAGETAHRGATWVNKLTAAQYLTYFDLLGFEVQKLWWSKMPIDEEFYLRFEDVLGRYPRYDLERDFLYAIVGHAGAATGGRAGAGVGRAAGSVAGTEVLQRQVAQLTRQRDRAQKQLTAMENSLSWQVTKPLRAAKREVRRRLDERARKSG